MKEVRFFHVPDAETVGCLPQEEAVHALRVLRIQTGDEMFLIDGVGHFYRAKVTLADNKHCAYEILEKLPQQREWLGRIHIAMAPTKVIDRVEWMVEKATEIGFDEISFLSCRFSERKVVKTERLEKIVVAAMKQSRKAWKPLVNDMVSFESFVKRPMDGFKCIAHCYEEIPRDDLFSLLGGTSGVSSSSPCHPECPSVVKPADTVTVLIGPEGDFSIDEVRMAIDHGFIPVSLGSFRLRTETAALAAVMMAHLTKRILPGTIPK
ncbi:MAG: 16S rRNA (uracil(1498)-N(3))-methyltransferase [Prevotella sp.]|nr:16S rRNA (uracil(1498)-N(3))-methyltransferase [Prevotella sp.]